MNKLFLRMRNFLLPRLVLYSKLWYIHTKPWYIHFKLWYVHFKPWYVHFKPWNIKLIGVVRTFSSRRYKFNIGGCRYTLGLGIKKRALMSAPIKRKKDVLN